MPLRLMFNMIHRLVVVLVLFIFAPITMWAQHVSGIVKGEDEVLQGASVALLNDSDAIVSYTITDRNGAFLLDVPLKGDVACICVSYLGYKREIVPLENVKEGMVICLEKSDFLLKEVAVRSERLKDHNDTLVYSVEGFVQAQDRTIADVIRKMPGIEVKPDGSIEYQGKPINKFYIEGLDLMGAQYGIANRNLPASMVKSVEIYKNHQPIKSLRNIKFSDCAALNLVLKDDAKSVWKGIFDLGIGYGDELLFDNRAMAMQFQKKFQTIMMYKGNKVGDDIGGEVRDLIAPQYRDRSINDADGILSLMSLPQPNIDSKRYTLNNSHVVAGNWLWRTGKDSNLRLQANGVLDKEELGSYRETTYLTLADLPVVVEEQNVRNSKSEWKGTIEYQLNSDKTFLSNIFRGYMDFNKSVGSMLYNGQGKEMMVRPHKQNINNDLHFSHTTSKGNVYDITSNLSYNHLPGLLLTINGTKEKLDLSHISSHNELKYKWKIGNYYLDNHLGLNYVSQKINDDGDYQLCQPYWTSVFSLKRKVWNVNASAMLSYANMSYNENSLSRLLIDPKLSLYWSPSGVSEFSFAASYTNTPLLGEKVFCTPLFTDYRTQRTNRGKPDMQHLLAVNVSYRYTNPIKGVFFNVQPLLNINYNNILYRTGFASGVYSVVATQKEYTSVTKGVSARISKSFSWAKSMVGWNINHRTRNCFIVVSDNINEVNMSLIASSLEYSLRPLHFVSVEGGTSVQVIQNRNRSNPQLGSGNIAYLEHKLNFFVLIGKPWMIRVSNELFHSSESDYGTNYYCDFSLSYKASRWELAFMANNILGNTAYRHRQINADMETYSITTLRPREFLVKFSFDI